MKMYVATFHGDIADKAPIAAHSLEDCLRLIQESYDYGKMVDEIISENETWTTYVTPDPEDDKIEIWEYDPENLVHRVVWGFWGWHWQMPEFTNDDFVETRDGSGQGIMPGNSKSLYELAMEE